MCLGVVNCPFQMHIKMFRWCMNLMQLEAGDMLAFSLLLDPPRLKVDVQKTHKKRVCPITLSGIETPKHSLCTNFSCPKPPDE